MFRRDLNDFKFVIISCLCTNKISLIYFTLNQHFSNISVDFDFKFQIKMKIRISKYKYERYSRHCVFFIIHSFFKKETYQLNAGKLFVCGDVLFVCA